MKISRAHARRVLAGLHADLDDINAPDIDTAGVIEHIAHELYENQGHMLVWTRQPPDVHARYRVVAATALNAVIDLVRAAQAPETKAPRTPKEVPTLALHHNASYDILAAGKVRARFRFDTYNQTFVQHGGRQESFALADVESVAPRFSIGSTEKANWFPVALVHIAA